LLSGTTKTGALALLALLLRMWSSCNQQAFKDGIKDTRSLSNIDEERLTVAAGRAQQDGSIWRSRAEILRVETARC